MTFQVDAVYLDGVLQLKSPLELPNGTVVRLAVETGTIDINGPSRDADALIDRLRSFRGMLRGVTRDQLLTDRRQGLP